MNIVTKTLLAGALACVTWSGVALAEGDLGKTAAIKPTAKDHPLTELYSGYYFATPQTRAIQDDDFENPGLLVVEKAKELWSKVDGEAGKSCQSCHNDVASSMKGVTARYPVYYEPKKKPITVELRINECREKFMKAKPWKYESPEVVGLSGLIAMQSRGMPMSVKVDGEMKPFFEKGKEFYYQRRGQLDMSCAKCHESYYGGYIRSELLSQGQVNGFPIYRLNWGVLGTTHKRFAECNKNIRAKPFDAGSDEYVNLDLYVRWRGQGLGIEGPGVRK